MMVDDEVYKEREVCFHALPPDQVVHALEILGKIEGIEVVPSNTKCCVVVRYDVREFTLEAIEQTLAEMRFHLDPSLMQKLKRALVGYTEGVQRENLSVPTKYYKSSLQVFVKAYKETLHGDEDFTPEEWRGYR